MKKWIFPLLIILTACMDDKLTPESALKDFIEDRVGKVVTRDYISERVTGKLKASLESMTDEEFTKFADLRSVEKGHFKILSKSCQEKTCYLTYTVAYQTEKKEETVYTSEVKKIAEIVSEGGKWLISDVSNVKTYHEALEPINPLE